MEHNYYFKIKDVSKWLDRWLIIIFLKEFFREKLKMSNYYFLYIKYVPNDWIDKYFKSIF